MDELGNNNVDVCEQFVAEDADPTPFYNKDNDRNSIADSFESKPTAQEIEAEEVEPVCSSVLKEEVPPVADERENSPETTIQTVEQISNSSYQDVIPVSPSDKISVEKIEEPQSSVALDEEIPSSIDAADSTSSSAKIQEKNERKFIFIHVLRIHV